MGLHCLLFIQAAGAHIIGDSGSRSLDELDNITDISDWIENNIADSFDAENVFSDIEDLKTIARTVKATQDRFGLPRLSAIKEYVGSARNFGYDEAQNALLVTSDYKGIPERIKSWASNEHTVQLFPDYVKGLTLHEMGHCLRKTRINEFNNLIKDDWQIDEYKTTSRSMDTRSESVAESFVLYYIGYTDRINKNYLKLFLNAEKGE